MSSFCGYGDAITLKNVDDGTIKYVENYMATEMLQILSDRLSLDESINYVDFFGKTFAAKPSNFKFKLGEVCQIKEIVVHLNMLMNNLSPIERSALFNPANLNELCDFEGTIYIENFGRYFTDAEASISRRMMLEVGTKLKWVLFNNIKNLFKEYGINPEFTERFNEDSFVVNKHGKNKTWIAKVECCLCVPGLKKSQFIVQSKMVNHEVYWINSNYGKHIRRMHKNVLNTVVSECAPLHVENKDEIEQLKTKIYNQMEKSFEHIAEKNTKKRDLNAEMEFFSKDEQIPAWLKVVKTARDGNCLFSSLVHQIFGHDYTRKKHMHLVKELRMDVVSHIKKNFLDFEFVLKNRIYEEANERVENIKKRSKKFVKTELSKDGTWGGTETIKAVGQIFGVNILVVNEKGTYHFTSGFDDLYDRIVFLAFRMNSLVMGGFDQLNNVNRNHYDSVVNIDGETKILMAEQLAIAENTRRAFQIENNADEIIDIVN